MHIKCTLCTWAQSPRQKEKIERAGKTESIKPTEEPAEPTELPLLTLAEPRLGSAGHRRSGGSEP